jgi:tetratricopeptide (TPR) repeat protein
MHRLRTLLSDLLRAPRYRNALVVAALALLVMMPSLGHDFVNWDDNRLITENEAVTTTPGILTIWSSLELPEQFPNYPLTNTMHWVEHQLWGFNPSGYHAMSILLHALNAVLVLVLLRRLGLNELTALLAAALFAAHPMQVESVAWVSERKNLLFTFFALLTMLSYLKYLDSGRRGAWAWALTALVAALLSKTAAVTVPCTLLATVWLKRDRVTLREVLPLAPFFVAALVAGLITMGVEQAPRDVLPLMLRPLLAVNNLAFYLARLVFPVAVVPVHPKWDFGPGGVFLIAPLVLIVVLGLLFRYRAKLPRIVWWGAAHFLLTLAPFLGLISFGYHATSYVADRYVYFASIGLFAPVAMGIVHVMGRFERKVALGACAVYVALMAALTLLYIPVWRDSFTLWTYTLKHNPDCGRAHNNLGVVYEGRGEFDMAMAHYLYSMMVDPQFSAAHANYATTMARLGNFEEAKKYFMRAIEVDGGKPLVHYRLACIYLQEKRFDAALVHLRIAARRDPELVDVYPAAGHAHDRLGNYDKAAELYRQTLEHMPAHPVAQRRLAVMLEKQREAVVSAEQVGDDLP